MKECGTCNLCCKVVGVETIGKPAGEWCPQAVPGRGCGVYAQRPNQCRSFECLWLAIDELGEEWKPSRCKFIVRADGPLGGMCVDVEPKYPDAWRDRKFYQSIKKWSAPIRQGAGIMLVYVGSKTYATFPEEDLFIGDVFAGDEIIMGYENNGILARPFVVVSQKDGAERRYAGRGFPLGQF